MLTSLSRCFTPEVPCLHGYKALWHFNPSLTTMGAALHQWPLSTGETWRPNTYLLFVHLLNCPLPLRLNVSGLHRRCQVALTLISSQRNRFSGYPNKEAVMWSITYRLLLPIVTVNNAPALTNGDRMRVDCFSASLYSIKLRPESLKWN